jgi:hypothetical protein
MKKAPDPQPPRVSAAISNGFDDNGLLKATLVEIPKD